MQGGDCVGRAEDGADGKAVARREREAANAADRNGDPPGDDSKVQQCAEHSEQRDLLQVPEEGAPLN